MADTALSKRRKFIGQIAGIPGLAIWLFLVFFFISGISIGSYVMYANASQKRTVNLYADATAAHSTKSSTCSGTTTCTKPVTAATSAPTSSSPSPTGATGQTTTTAQAASSPAQPAGAPAMTVSCTTLYSNLAANYQMSVDKLANTLANEESAASSQALTSGLNVLSLSGLINGDITTTNTAIANAWTSDVTNGLTASCNSPVGIKILKIPMCDMVDLRGVNGCIGQIDSSLGISS